MKKLIVLILLLSIFQVGSRSFAANPTVEPAGFIHYQVNIRNNVPAGLNICSSVVLITDAAGNLVSNVLPYKPNVAVYDFYEAGPVIGSRVARVAVLPLDAGIACPVAPAPSMKRGPFTNGQTYYFYMIYGPKIPVPYETVNGIL